MKRQIVGEIVVLPVTQTVVDVFVGKGWDNWTRFEKSGRILKKLAGQSVTDAEYSKLMEMA
jgi:hypothetical protein